jgi:hypothetical protein
MKTGDVIRNNDAKVVQIKGSSEGVGRWLSSLFGCRHREMSRPFSGQGQTYRTCLECGARRDFSLNSWEMRGNFYYGLPAVNNLRGRTAVTSR